MAGIKRNYRPIRREAVYVSKLTPLNSIGTSIGTKIKKLMSTAAIWWIWNERCKRSFRGSSRVKEVILHNKIKSVKSKSLVLNIGTVITPTCSKLLTCLEIAHHIPKNPIRWTSWIPQEEGTLKINTDASVDKDVAAIGVICRDQLGEMKWAVSRQVRPQKIYLLEMHAILVVVQQATACSYLWVETDSEVTCNVIKGDYKCPWEAIYIKAKIIDALEALCS